MSLQNLNLIYIIAIYLSNIPTGHTMETTKIFMSGRSQAVRLPKAYRLEGTEVFIKKVGNAIVLIPEAGPWETLLQGLEQFEPGFKLQREQPAAQQERDALLP